MLVALARWRFHRSPAGHVLVAIRENEQRARFIGYPTNRYKLLGFVVWRGADQPPPATEAPEPDRDWDVLADPEDNEFCVFAP